MGVIVPSDGVVHVRVITPVLSPMVDASSINLAFKAVQIGGSDVSDLVSALKLFQQDWQSYTGSFVINSATNLGTIETYDITSHLDGSPAGSPIQIDTYTAAHASSPDPCVNGAAIAISYRAVYGTDVEFLPGSRPRSRDRGRFYLGPIEGTAIANLPGDNRCALTAGVAANILAQLPVRFGASSPIAGKWEWSVWSRKNASVKPVEHIQYDDRPDYQRRRSDSPGVITTGTFP